MGLEVGTSVGLVVGNLLGLEEGEFVCGLLGFDVGALLGSGVSIGCRLGSKVGSMLGCVGLAEGDTVGTFKTVGPNVDTLEDRLARVLVLEAFENVVGEDVGSREIVGPSVRFAFLEDLGRFIVLDLCFEGLWPG